MGIKEEVEAARKAKKISGGLSLAERAAAARAEAEKRKKEGGADNAAAIAGLRKRQGEGLTKMEEGEEVWYDQQGNPHRRSTLK